MDPMNLEILHGTVGPFRQGDVVPVSAVAGGHDECERLCQIGAAKWCEQTPTVEPPAAMSAVMEMSDDELIAENKRLRGILDRADEAIREKIKETELVAAAEKERGDRLEAMCLKLADRAATQSGILSRLAEGGKVNLQVLRDIPDGPKAGEIVSPTAVAADLHELLDSGAVGWTEKPVPVASPSPDETPTNPSLSVEAEGQVVLPANPEPNPDATPEKPAPKKGKK